MIFYHKYQSNEHFPVDSSVVVYVPPYPEVNEANTASLSYWIVPGTAGED